MLNDGEVLGLTVVSFRFPLCHFERSREVTAADLNPNTVSTTLDLTLENPLIRKTQILLIPNNNMVQ